MSEGLADLTSLPKSSSLPLLCWLESFLRRFFLFLANFSFNRRSCSLLSANQTHNLKWELLIYKRMLSFMCNIIVILERHQILVISSVSHEKQSESSLLSAKNISYLPCKSQNASGCACGQQDTSCLPLSHSSTKKYNLSPPVSLKYKKIQLVSPCLTQVQQDTTCLPLSHSSTTGYNLSPPVSPKYNRRQIILPTFFIIIMDSPQIFLILLHNSIFLIFCNCGIVDQNL